jgi:HEAT repeat protein
LDVLLAVVSEPENHRWQNAVDKLTKFPDDPRVVPALTNSLQSPDSRIRESARIALRQLEIAKKQKP